MVEWLAGNRIRGTSTERTTTAGIGNTVGGWVEVGRTTLGSANASITVSSLPDKRYYKYLLGGGTKSANFDTVIRLNGDSNPNYANRYTYNDTLNSNTGSTGGYIYVTGNASTTPDFSVGYLANLATKEKLGMSWACRGMTAGAGYEPQRSECVFKHVQTTNPISSITATSTSASTFGIGAELVVLGWDESDTHTDNFWEPLGSTTLATAGDNIEVTFTAKKYLMVKLYRKPTGAANARWTFNNDGGANYAKRKSSDGSTDSTSEGLNQNYFTQYTYDNSEPSYSSTIIVNTAGAEKLGTQHEMNRLTAGAGNAPHRSESVFKWANTSDQITTIDITNSKSGSYDVGSIIEVWGHD